jgi:lipopolysaccharide transport system ATP-binding protein
MSETAIVVENVSKRYLIGHRLSSTGPYKYTALRDVVGREIRNFTRKAADVVRGRQMVQGDELEEFWALKDVSFEVRKGEVLGIIGRNGAGKSTLLKILSRITEPTQGRVILRGRASSLLEVGTGFHPELTGRENIFLNGAILGMTQQEIRRQFDEIVAFAEVEKFLDTPVKHYSSGMYVRLAFAVAAHLEPEILIIDEVLAVGDSEFQKKCLGKMDEVSRTQGRTVIFVSHNIQAIQTLCPTAIFLHQGNLISKGRTQQLIAQYLSSQEGTSQAIWSFANAPGIPPAKLHAVRVLDENRNLQLAFDTAKSIILQIEFWVLRSARLTPAFWVFNQHGTLLFATANLHDSEWGNKEYQPGLYSCSCVIPAHFLNSGVHNIRAWITKDTSVVLIDLPEIVSFNIFETGEDRGAYAGQWLGAVRPLLSWHGERIGDLADLPLI